MAARITAGLMLLVLIVMPVSAITYKLVVLEYRLADMLPRTEYRVTTHMSLDGQLSRVRVQTFVPVSDERQQIRDEVQVSDPAFRFSVESTGHDRRAQWSGAGVPDDVQLAYSYSALARPLRYIIDPTLPVPEGYASPVRRYLQPNEHIQVDDPDITAALVRIGADEGPLRTRLQRIFDFTAGLASKPFKGTTDALTALRLGEASCNGKSRLFVALARATGIPARLVGGLIMEPGRKRTSHQWVEAYVGGRWVPFGPTNGHFAALPANYLVLYHGDRSLFSHTADINFDYGFATDTRFVPSPRVRETFRGFNVWDLFERLNLPFSLLRTVLMLPIGALVVVLFRNVIGMPTFGTFLPALIAAAAGETGLLWGVVSLLIVTLSVVAARRLIHDLRLLHSPTLAILLAVVVLAMLGTSLLAEHLGLPQLARVSYFPIAVMAIASERLYLALVEQGPLSASKQLGGTLVVVLGCYVVMNSLAIQMLVSAFPEVLLLVIAANVYLGRWVGVRLSELWRFRATLRPEATP
jgi:transglutaminase-like putative cysteine protease